MWSGREKELRFYFILFYFYVISSLQGHKLCEDCQDQVKARENNNKRDVCLLCNISELTKPTVLEKVLGHGAAIFHL